MKETIKEKIAIIFGVSAASVIGIIYILFCILCALAPILLAAAAIKYLFF